MRNSIRMALAMPLVLACAAAHAQIFVCKDASGRTLTSDRPIPECADRAMRELDKRGNTKREIPAPMTAEERRQQQLREEKRKADEAAAEEQKREDRLIRMRYRNEADIEAARKRSVALLDERLKRDRSDLAAAEKQRQQAQSDVETKSKKNAPVPVGMQRRVEDANQAVEIAKKQIRDDEAEAAKVNARFDATLKRYRELGSPTAAK